MKSEVIELAKEWREQTHEADSPMPAMLLVYINDELAIILHPRVYELSDIEGAIALCRHTLDSQYMAFVNDCRMRLFAEDADADDAEIIGDSLAIYSTDRESILLPYKFKGKKIEWLKQPDEYEMGGGRVPSGIDFAYSNPPPAEVAIIRREANTCENKARILTLSALKMLHHRFDVRITNKGPLSWTC